MRIKATEERDRLWENLCEATDENARLKALDRAARYYLRMCGGIAAYGRGNIQTLLDEADALRSMVSRALYNQERLDEIEVDEELKERLSEIEEHIKDLDKTWWERIFGSRQRGYPSWLLPNSVKQPSG